MNQKNRTSNNFSIVKELRKNNKSNEYFEIMLNNLTIEELISLKLELAYKNFGVPIYGIRLWQSLPSITRESVLKYIISITNSKSQAARLLGLSLSDYNKVIKKYNLNNLYS